MGAQASGQLRVNRQQGFVHSAAVALHVLQAERQGRLVNIGEHVAEKRFVLLAAHAQSRLSHMIAIRYRRWQMVAASLSERLDLCAQQGQRGGVIDQVMEQQHRHPALVDRIFGVMQAHHRCLMQVHAYPSWIELCLQLGRDITLVRVRQKRLDPQPCLTPDHLHWLVELFPGYRRAQNVVTVNDLLQGLREVQQLLEAIEPQQRLQQVRITLSTGQMVVEDALLQRHQPIDILHVAHPARHCGDHTVDLCLGEPGQGQHVRRYTLAIGGNPAGWHLHVCGLAAGGRQRGQGRLAEQYAHVGIQTDVAHALDQFYRQHRMSTQFEELVMSAYLLDAQQLYPQCGQPGFHQALRRLILTPGEGLGSWYRQCLAVELAVGSQRESLQADKSARQHVLGQR